MKANILKLGDKISKKSAKAMQGIVNSTKKFGKSIKKNARIKQRLRITKKKFSKRMRERKKRRQEELQLEQQQQQDKDNKPAEESKSGGPFGRLMSIIQTLLIGFVLNKLPQIIDFIKKVIKVIRDIVDKFKNFFNGVKDFFKQIGNVINKAFDVISNLSFDNIKEKVLGAFDKFKESFSNIKKNISDGIKKFLGLEKKKTKKELKQNLETDDLDNQKNKDSITDMNQTLTGLSSSWNNTTKKIEEVGTGVDIVGSEFVDKKIETGTETEETTTKGTDTESNLNLKKETSLKIEGSSGGDSGGDIFRESIKSDTGTITFDGKTFPKGLSGSGETFGGKGGSTYGDELNINESKIKVDTSSLTPERSGQKVFISGTKGGQGGRPLGSTTQRQGGGTRIVVKRDDFHKKLLDLALTS